MVDLKKNNFMTLSEKAQYYACKVHKETNHKYDGQDYRIHLAYVVFKAHDFIHLIPESQREMVLAACWAHDVKQLYYADKPQSQSMKCGKALSNGLNQ
jgi:hypothetical protein